MVIIIAPAISVIVAVCMFLDDPVILQATDHKIGILVALGH